MLDDLEPDSELPPKKGKPDQTKDVEKPQPDLNDRKGESKDEENVDRETQDDVDRQPAPIAPKLVISSEPTVERVYRTLPPFPSINSKTKRKIEKSMCKKYFDKVVIEMPLSDAMKVSPSIKKYVKDMVSQSSPTSEQGVMMIS